MNYCKPFAFVLAFVLAWAVGTADAQHRIVQGNPLAGTPTADSLTVTGDFVAGTSVRVPADANACFGPDTSAANAAIIRLDTAETNGDALRVGVPTTGRHVGIMDADDVSCNRALANASYPIATFWSHNCSSTQGVQVYHDGSNPTVKALLGVVTFDGPDAGGVVARTTADKFMLFQGAGGTCFRTTSNCIRQNSGVQLLAGNSGSPEKGVYVTSARLQTAKGTNVVAANDLAIPKDGNLIVVTGNTTINAINTTDMQAGSLPICLEFTGTPTVKHNTAGGASTAPLIFASGADFSATADDLVCVIYNGTVWKVTVALAY